MARYKTSQKLTIRIPFEDLEELRNLHGKKVASYLRDLIKQNLKKKLDPKPPKSAMGYCNNLHCKYGQIPEKIQLLFDEKNQAWYCLYCQEFTPDIDEKTIKGERNETK